MANNLLVKVDTTNVPDGRVIFWKVAHGTTDVSDFENTSGSAVIYNNSAEFFIRAVADPLWENAETFQIEIYDGPDENAELLTIGPIVSLMNSTSQPVISINPSSNTVVEGGSLEVNISASQAADGSVLYWTIKHINTVAEDFTKTAGSAVISKGSGQLKINIPMDVYFEGDKEFEIEIRSGSPTGPVLATSQPIKLTNEPSEPVYKLSASPDVLDEGGTFYFNVSGSNIPDGTTLYWTVNHTTTGSSDFNAETGTIVVNQNSAAFAIDTVINQEFTEDKIFTVSVREGGSTGAVKSTTPSLTIKNNSILSYKATVDKRSIYEDEAIVVTVETSGVANGTMLYWFIRHGTTDASDFATTAGSTTVVSNKATFTVRSLVDFENETGEAFQIEIRSGSVTGEIVANVSSLTLSNVVPVSSFIFLPNNTVLDEEGLMPVDEGGALVLSVEGSSNPWIGTLFWEIEHIDTQNSDFLATTGSLSMPVTGATTLSIDTVTNEDFTGDKKFKVNFYSDVNKLHLLGTAPVAKIVDKTTPAFSITAHAEQLSEGGVVSAQINASNVPDNYVVYWSVLHESTSDEDFEVVKGATVISNGSANFSINTNRDDIWESTETFRLEVRVGGSSGNVVAVSQSIKLVEKYNNMYTACCIFDPEVTVDAKSLFVLGRK